jgi:hypothetical protein
MSAELRLSPSLDELLRAADLLDDMQERLLTARIANSAAFAALSDAQVEELFKGQAKKFVKFVKTAVANARTAQVPTPTPAPVAAPVHAAATRRRVVCSSGGGAAAASRGARHTSAGIRALQSFGAGMSARTLEACCTPCNR